ncbi:MAG: hypothetical protein COA79_08930 [Planctomycetota bacterium]|nr:MAG: hypothetical protein COA79_08930 [Planctomycetota bacterium]
MKDIREFNLRSELHKYISEKLLKTAINSIDRQGKSLMDSSEGALWSGTVVLVIGEIKRLLREDISNVEGKNLVEVATNILKTWDTQSEIDTCFTGLGLSSWGALDDNHPIYSQLSNKEKKKLYSTLAVTRDFKNNWEAFNSCIEAGNSILKPDVKNTIEVHINKIIENYTKTGYFDDADNKGNYNSYGLMSLNYCLKALEVLPEKNNFKKKLIDQFRPHFLTYFSLVKAMTFGDGTGWVFGRSAGVLGQLQIIIFLEQALAHSFIAGDDAAWARGAIKQITYKMVELFWDEKKQWFCFRDEFHTPYSYRKTYPMHWDLLRYFMQAMEYALEDEKMVDQKEISLKGEHKCTEIITNKELQTSIFIWSDGLDQFVLPIMGGPNRLTTDCLPKPFCRGIIEGVTENLKPIWVPMLTINKLTYMPANFASSTKVNSEDGWDNYEVIYDKICSVDKGEEPISSISFKTIYSFRSNSFKREDVIFIKKDNLIIESFNMELLQSAPHPKRVSGYGKVCQIKPTLQSSISQITMSEPTAIDGDLSYRNYYGLPTSKWVVSGENISLTQGEYNVVTEISW